MFTGIVQALGEVRVRDVGEGGLTVYAPSLVRDLPVGGSVAVNGVCLTAVTVDPRAGTFTADLSPETLRRTTLGELTEGDRVNLELPLRVGDPLGGHLLQGHVDTVGEVLAVEPQPDGSYLFTFRVDPEYDPWIVEKGSIAVDGISLTPFGVEGGRFQVAVIPHTYRRTTLQARGPGARVNVEFDILAKYVAKHLAGVQGGSGRGSGGGTGRECR